MRQIQIGSFQAAAPDKGAAAFLFLPDRSSNNQSPHKEPEPHKEVERQMTLTAVVETDLEQALPCHLVDPDLFFAESPADVERAKALCIDCPLRANCLAEALERREPWGVWGGELVLQGVVVPRKRPRGRPRKTEVAA